MIFFLQFQRIVNNFFCCFDVLGLPLYELLICKQPGILCSDPAISSEKYILPVSFKIFISHIIISEFIWWKLRNLLEKYQKTSALQTWQSSLLFSAPPPVPGFWNKFNIFKSWFDGLKFGFHILPYLIAQLNFYKNHKQILLKSNDLGRCDLFWSIMGLFCDIKCVCMYEKLSITQFFWHIAF